MGLCFWLVCLLSLTVRCGCVDDPVRRSRSTARDDSDINTIREQMQQMTDQYQEIQRQVGNMVREFRSEITYLRAELRHIREHYEQLQQQVNDVTELGQEAVNVSAWQIQLEAVVHQLMLLSVHQQKVSRLSVRFKTSVCCFPNDNNF